MPRSTYAKSVFINCPFDDQYQKYFRAIVFTVQDCGFIPRCAKEFGTATEPRIQKIQRIISICRLSIHDLSRTDLDPVYGLPRFNMPFELGLFLGAQRFGERKQKQKECLILDRAKYRYQKYISDISGQDIEKHENKIPVLIQVTRDWLSDRSKYIIPSPASMVDRYNQFKKTLRVFALSWNLDSRSLTFKNLNWLIGQWLDINPW